jgi:hypothetical protein
MTPCARCPHARHADRCWEVVEKAGQKLLCPCSEFWGYADLGGCDVEEHDGGLGSRRVVERWEWEEERHLERTRG